MSQWTHVAGAIRIDALRTVIPMDYEQAVHDVIGQSTVIDWDSIDLRGIPNPSHGEDVPSGSEGPIEYLIHENPMKSSMAAFDVLVWGDLRDFGEEGVSAIGDWLAGIIVGVREHSMSIRSLIVKVDVEYGPSHTFYLDDEGLLTESVKEYQERPV